MLLCRLPPRKQSPKAVTDQYGFTRPAPYEDQDIADIVSSIRNQTDSGAKLLMVGHSQGSIYLTLVYNKLIALGWKPQTIGAVGIAVAYSSIPTGNAYTTSANDVVIDAVRIATAGKILRPTLSNRYRPTIDPLGHNLRETYLHDLNPRSIDQIKNNISAEFQTIKTSLPKTKWSDTVYNSLQWIQAGPGESPVSRAEQTRSSLKRPFTSTPRPAAPQTSGAMSPAHRCRHRTRQNKRLDLLLADARKAKGTPRGRGL